MKKIIAGSGIALLMAAGIATGSALPASAALACGSGNICAYDVPTFNGTRLSNSNASFVDVPDDRTQSTKNLTTRGYSARNTVGLGSQELVYFPSGFQLQDYGANNRRVDHFDRV